MKTDCFDYQLPPEAIAQRPAERREMARLMVLGPQSDAPIDRTMVDWPGLVPPGSLVVLNDTKVVKARLLGHKAKTGGKVELLLVEPRKGHLDGERWRALGKGLGALVGEELVLAGGALAARVEAQCADGLFDLRLVAPSGSVEQALDAHGHVPIPPYIRRGDDESDVERYQTVYARVPGAIAAPTAGLHLTEPLLKELRHRDVVVATLTLHVGLGTFQPVGSEDLDQHPIHAEWMSVAPDLAREVAAARRRGAPIVAVGTTVVRALESAADPDRPGSIVPLQGETRLLIQPGHRFRIVDALLTNFHLPRSTLLALVAAFAGRERVLAAYREAVRRGYRFYSYGDAMWLPARGGA